MSDTVVIPPFPALDASLRDAIEYVLAIAPNGGGICPCCQQGVKVYKRKLASSAAYGLITMYRHHGTAFGHAPTTADLARLGGELARLSLWGLLEEKSEMRDDGGRAGWWRVTERGEAFVQNRCRVPKHVRVYAGQVLGLDNIETTSVLEALGDKFNYAELMGMKVGE